MARPAVTNHLETYAVLAGYRTVREVCDAVGLEYLRLHGHPYARQPGGGVGIPVKTWYAWVAGRLPHPDLIAPITRALRAPRSALWRYPGEYLDDPAAPDHDRLDPGGEIDLNRRAALHTLGAALLVPLDHAFLATLAGRPAGGDRGALEVLAGDVATLSRGGWRVPAAELLPVSAGKLAEVRAWRARARSAGDRRDGDQLLAQAALVVAWHHYSANKPHQAVSYFLEAERAAVAAGDQPLAAAAIVRGAALGLIGNPRLGDPAQSLGEVQRAGRYVLGGRSIVAARVASMAARCHLELGHDRDAFAALRQVEQVLDRATDRGARVGLWGFAPRQLDIAAAEVENAFGDPRKALDHAAVGLRSSPAGELIDRSVLYLEQADAHLRLRDVDAAVAVAGPVLLEVPPAAYAGTLGARLAGFLGRLGNVRARPAVALLQAHRDHRRTTASSMP